MREFDVHGPVTSQLFLAILLFRLTTMFLLQIGVAF